MNEDDLSKLSLPLDLQLIGHVQLLKFIKDAPIVFLLDENHGNLNNCINNNIINAEILITKAEIGIVGVESLAGGEEWERDTETYYDQESDRFYFKQVSEYVSDCTMFVNGLHPSFTHLLQGVESINILDRIFELPVIEGQRHPSHKKRSKHFIKTLFESYSLEKISGNLILNCGIEHNDDIEGWINSNEIDTITEVVASYVRINTINQ